MGWLDGYIKNYKTESCGNLYAFIWERCIQIVAQGCYIGLIIPVASICTGRFSPLQDYLFQSGTAITSNFNDRPSKLFDGLEHSRLSIIIHKKQSHSRRLFSSSYSKWTTEERAMIFSKLAYVETTPFSTSGAMAKIGNKLELRILRKLFDNKSSISVCVRQNASNKLYFTRKLSYFVQVLNFVPTIIDSSGNRREPSELKILSFGSKEILLSILSLLNSNLFYWWTTCYSDCRNLNKREIMNFPFDPNRSSPKILTSLQSLAVKLMQDLIDHSEMRKMNFKSVGTLRIQCTIPRLSKNIIDEIDCVLAEHYGFTEEELDFIINYDVKYRLGLYSL